MPELQQLDAGHGPAILAFELANRAYFAEFISDRGDDFFDQFADRYKALLAEQNAGVGAYYVLVADDGSMERTLPRQNPIAGRSLGQSVSI